MSEQLLDGHYIHSAIYQPGSERMPQLMPRNALNAGFPACERETLVEINERFPGFVVVENELVLSSQSPSFQNSSRFRIDRNRSGLVSLVRKDRKKAVFEIHVLPAKRKNFTDT
jgi:hypothetical protein